MTTGEEFLQAFHPFDAILDSVQLRLIVDNNILVKHPRLKQRNVNLFPLSLSNEHFNREEIFEVSIILGIFQSEKQTMSWWSCWTRRPCISMRGSSHQPPSTNKILTQGANLCLLMCNRHWYEVTDQGSAFWHTRFHSVFAVVWSWSGYSRPSLDFHFIINKWKRTEIGTC